MRALGKCRPKARQIVLDLDKDFRSERLAIFNNFNLRNKMLDQDPEADGFHNLIT